MQKEIVVVGGGLSGTAVAVRLLQALSESARITVFEPADELGRGIAYGTECNRHLLNVRAAGMSLFPEKPTDFATWLSAKKLPLEAPIEKQFAPRMVYREYVQDRLREAREQRAESVEFEHRQAQAVALEDGQIVASDGSKVKATHLVLALGNLKPRLPGLLGRLSDSPRVFADPWGPHVLSNVPEHGTVLVIGTGLTMIDVVLQLRQGGFKGKIFAVSRRGQLPQVHEDVPPLEQPKPNPESALDLLRTLIHECRSADASGKNWRSIIDGLRPYNQQTWAAMPLHEKHRFMRHLQTYWDIHRHRIAPAISQVIQSEIAAGTLVVLGGRIESAIESMQGVEVKVRLRTGKNRVILADQVINCTGPAADWRGSQVPLVESLIEQEIAEYDVLGMGLTIDESCVCKGTSSTPQTYAIGPLTKGTFWETTAAPEIRVQAKKIAESINAS